MRREEAGEGGKEILQFVVGGEKSVAFDCNVNVQHAKAAKGGRRKSLLPIRPCVPIPPTAAGAHVISSTSLP